MKRLFLLLSILFCITTCKNSKDDLNGSEKVSTENFLKAFHEIDLPLIVSDTSLQNFGDTILISKTVFTQFIPDSALEKFSIKQDNYVIHPAGMIHKKERDFLLAIFSSGKKIQLNVFVLDDKHNFLTSLPLLNNALKDDYKHSLSITDEPTFIIKREKFKADNTSMYSRIGYAYNSTLKSFAEVLKDSNEDTAKNNDVINPIDTLLSTNKYSGDYSSDKKNFISIRDGKNASSYAFFIHFEKNNGDCTGELKGVMTMKDDKTAIFSENGDPCVIDFKFSKNAVSIKEQGNCGNHRGITCPFDFTFKKKAAVKKKPK